MKKNTLTALASILIATSLAGLVAAGGGDGGTRIGPISVFALCAVVAFAVNWLAFIPANNAKTERFYDLTGSLTYLTVITIAALFSQDMDARATIVAAMVAVWAVRLGSFLFLRIKRDGKDDRFDEIKTNPLRFFVAWTLQGLWVVLTAACALAIITGAERVPIGWVGVTGMVIWLFGFAVEIVADAQKSKFKKDADNQGKFISCGLWSWSRHPNYFGEMVLWTGIAIIALPVLAGWQWVTLISPVFVYLLINHISGVNKLEAKADQKWGHLPEYQTYKKRTSVLILRPPSSQQSD